MVILLLACTDKAPTPIASQPTPTPGTPATPLCPTLGEFEVLGALPSPPATEISGLAVTSDRLWAHNDSGDLAAVLGFEHDGTPTGTWQLDGVDAFDFEDMAHDGDGTLFIGDIGDNPQARPDVTIYVVPEPMEDGGGLLPSTALRRSYPDGPRDAETLLFDDSDGSVWIVSKELDGRTGFYRTDSTGPESDVLERMATIQMGTEPLGQATQVTGGDLGPHGLVLRTYLTTAFVWPRLPGEGLETVLQREPCSIEIAPEPQGEAIAWSPDGIFTVSEGTTPAVHFHPLEP